MLHSDCTVFALCCTEVFGCWESSFRFGFNAKTPRPEGRWRSQEEEEKLEFCTRVSRKWLVWRYPVFSGVQKYRNFQCLEKLWARAFLAMAWEKDFITTGERRRQFGVLQLRMRGRDLIRAHSNARSTSCVLRLLEEAFASGSRSYVVFAVDEGFLTF
jgi:hypothetical protein